MSRQDSLTNSKDVEAEIKLKDDEKPSKLLRVITVSAYIFSVSFAAMMLSLYYIFIWTPVHPKHGRLEGGEDLGIPEIMSSNHL